MYYNIITNQIISKLPSVFTLLDGTTIHGIISNDILATQGIIPYYEYTYNPYTHKRGVNIIIESDGLSSSMEIIPKTEEEIIEDKKQIILQVWKNIQDKRELHRVGGIYCNNKWFHSDDSSRIQYLGLKLLGDSIPTGIMWKTMDGSFIEMSVDIVNNITQSLISTDTFNFNIAEQHHINMKLTIDPRTYDFSANWLPIYIGF